MFIVIFEKNITPIGIPCTIHKSSIWLQPYLTYVQINQLFLCFKCKLFALVFSMLSIVNTWLSETNYASNTANDCHT